MLDDGRADGRCMVVQVPSGCGLGVEHAHRRHRLVQCLGCPDGVGSTGRVEEVHMLPKNTPADPDVIVDAATKFGTGSHLITSPFVSKKTRRR